MALVYYQFCYLAKPARMSHHALSFYVIMIQYNLLKVICHTLSGQERTKKVPERAQGETTEQANSLLSRFGLVTRHMHSSGRFLIADRSCLGVTRIVV